MQFKQNGQSTEIELLNNFGKIGNLIQLELKMIWRGKRSKSFIFLTLVFVLYGFMIYTKESLIQNHTILLAFGIFTTSIFTMQYVQLLFAWESSFFDFLNTKNISANEYLSSKYYLLIVTNLICFILSLPYAFFGIEIIAIHFVAFLFNSGFNIFVQIYFGTLNKTRIDTSKGAFFNHEGIHVIQYIVILPLIALPIAIFYLFQTINYTNIGLIVIGSLGLFGFIFRNSIIKRLAKQLKKKKYAMLVGFRK